MENIETLRQRSKKLEIEINIEKENFMKDALDFYKRLADAKNEELEEFRLEAYYTLEQYEENIKELKDEKLKLDIKILAAAMNEK